MYSYAVQVQYKYSRKRIVYKSYNVVQQMCTQKQPARLLVIIVEFSGKTAFYGDR